jgi:hypothetical protein
LKHGIVATVGAGASWVAVAVLCVSACAHDDSSMFISQVVLPTPGATTGCVYQSDPTQVALISGTLDIAFRSSYSAVLLVANQLVSRGSSDDVRTETARVTLEGAVVRVTDSAGTELRSFTSLSSGTAAPASGTTPGYGLMRVTLVDEQSADTALATAALREQKSLRSYIRAFGTTLGGQHVESNEFPFNVTVCRGCLVSFPAESNDKVQQQATGKLNCNATPATTTDITVPCVFGQDANIDCRLCRAQAECQP